MQSDDRFPIPHPDSRFTPLHPRSTAYTSMSLQGEKCPATAAPAERISAGDSSVAAAASASGGAKKRKQGEDKKDQEGQTQRHT